MLLRKGDIGVGSIQQALVEAGENVSADELASGVFGPSTELAVRDFQARHVDANGHALGEDGIVGPGTMWALLHPNGGGPGARFTAPGWRCEPSEAREAVRRVLEVAVGELVLGVTEQPDGSNRGPRVDVYTAPDLGIPWCAAFVSYCFARGVDAGSPFGRILSALKMRDWAAANSRLLGIAALPQPGDVFIILRGDLHGHVGLIVGNTPDGRMLTIEGNAGNAVRGLIRARASVTAIARPIPLI